MDKGNTTHAPVNPPWPPINRPKNRKRERRESREKRRRHHTGDQERALVSTHASSFPSTPLLHRISFSFPAPSSSRPARHRKRTPFSLNQKPKNRNSPARWRAGLPWRSGEQLAELRKWPELWALQSEECKVEGVARVLGRKPSCSRREEERKSVGVWRASGCIIEWGNWCFGAGHGHLRLRGSIRSHGKHWHVWVFPFFFSLVCRKKK